MLFIFLITISSCTATPKVYNSNELFTAEDFKSNFNLNYYSSLLLAIEDINNGTIGENADSNKQDAIAGVFISEDKIYAILLKDSTEVEPLMIQSEMTLNLCGNSLSVNNVLGIGVSSNLIIDGRVEGSSIVIDNDDGASATAVYVQSGHCQILGGSYIGKTVNADTFCIVVYKDAILSASDATFSSTDSGSGMIRTVIVYKDGNATFTNSTIIGEATDCTIYTIYNEGNIDLKNCSVKASAETRGCISTYNNGHMTIKDSELSGCSVDFKGSALSNLGNIEISNCRINGSSVNQRGFGIENILNATIENCDINVSSQVNSYGICNYENGNITLTDCNVLAYSNYHSNDNGYASASIGIIDYGISTINNCYAMGTHSGVSANGETTINGGTFESFGHGGIYFCGPGKTSYVRNAIIRSCDMPEGYTYSEDNDNDTGFYIGGGVGADNIVVYMDNCDIYGEKYPIVLRGTSGEKNNTLYISNSRIYSEKRIRIDTLTHKLYLGVGNNFDESNTQIQKCVIKTDNVYVKENIEK